MYMQVFVQMQLLTPDGVPSICMYTAIPSSILNFYMINFTMVITFTEDSNKIYPFFMIRFDGEKVI